MKKLTKKQVQGVIDWMNEYQQLKDTAIPLRFKEQFTKQLSLADVLNCKKYEFGKNHYYQSGQVCVWNGRTPCILRIKEQGGCANCYRATIDSHNSLYIGHIRPATKKEIKALGDKEVLFIV